MTSTKFLGVKFLYRVIYIQHISHHAKFEFSSLSSLANTEGDLKRPPGTTRDKIAWEE